VNIQIVGSIQSFTGNLGAQGVSGDVIVTNIKAESVRDFITQVKQQTEQLAREGVDRKELHRIIKAIEEGLDAKKPISVISQLLEELKGVVVKVGAKLVSTGVLAMLNQLLSTGIPTV
jgi:predicted transcriptional regulator